MSQLSIVDFADTAEGTAFYRAYDRVLKKWPSEVTGVDFVTEYGTTRANICGPLDGPPLFLLPGAGATSSVWFANIAALAEHHRVFAVDLIGDPGRSTANGVPLRSVDDLMSWLHAVTRAAGCHTFSLAGHSYGAMIALAYAIRAPEDVRNLVLLDPNSCFTGMRASYLAHAVPLLMRPTEKRERDFIRWETDGQNIDNDWLDLLAHGAAYFPKSKTVVPKRPKLNALKNMTVDTTAIFASGSKVHGSKRLVKTLAATLPAIHAVTIEEATHHTLPMIPAAAINDALTNALHER